MTWHLIVIETQGAGAAYHTTPYRLAGSLDEAKELMRNYMQIGADAEYIVPDFFLVYEERGGDFLTEALVYDPNSIEPADADDYQEFLRETGRI